MRRKYTDLSKYSIDRLQGMLEEHYRGEVNLESHIISAIERIIDFKKRN